MSEANEEPVQVWIKMDGNDFHITFYFDSLDDGQAFARAATLARDVNEVLLIYGGFRFRIFPSFRV
jgi:hypothetical protein